MVDMSDPEVIESLKYLLVPREEKIRTQARPYDSKKNFFAPDKKEGYLCAEIQSEKGDMVTLKTSDDKTITCKRDELLQMNPPKYEKCDDMADLTYLNDATVYHNLRERYISWYIYTYSGLFCVTINPFKRLPLYTMKMVNFYRGKKKSEVPPHLYLVADNAYSDMCRDKANQSLLITGESGAGKTENTKKVIQYFAFVAANVGKKKNVEVDANKPSLEDQIVSANPVLEAYGNAKTTRNNNSSRFGKFIRIHFTQNFGIAGADIESYLLEKSRITYCMECERNYHIFYQLCSSAFPELSKEILLEADPGKYFFVNQGMLTIDRVDDAQEMRDTKTAFDILQFTQQQQIDLFKCTSAVANWGNTSWKQRPREEQAEPESTEPLSKVATLLGIEEADLIKGLTKPRIKVGNDFVNKGQNKEQCLNSVGALSKAIFSRCFTWLVEVVNVTLDVKDLTRAHFIGVLDIAGFETFEYNGFEQLCINFTNERLQQFFNNFMFVLEQQEYTKEGIVWEMMSFGADLQATIDLIEKPLGIFSILEEQCIVPKANDMTFKEALYKQHMGKHPSFGKPKPKKGSKFEAHFDLNHYAGIVSYSVDGWLEKNKDPINMTVATLFKNSKGNALLKYLFRDIGSEEAGGGGGKKGKSGSSNTISAGHRDQLSKLMRTLDATKPHFVRCIIPNELKTGGVLDAHLVMHQLHCNGVLEGIRICRKGFPSRLIYDEFLNRYGILAAEKVKSISDKKTACAAVLEHIKLEEDAYRVGLSKVLFRAGILGYLEELRDEVIVRVLTLLQCQIRRYLIKKNIKQMLQQRIALNMIQKNARAYLSLRNWGWFRLFSNIKPLLCSAKKEEERLAKEAEEARLKELEQERIRIENERRAAQALEMATSLKKLEDENSQLSSDLQSFKQKSTDLEQTVNKFVKDKSEMEKFISELEDKLLTTDHQANELGSKKKKLEAELSEIKTSLTQTENKLSKAENDIKSKDSRFNKAKDEMANLDETICKLTKDKKRLEELANQTTEQLALEEDKVRHLNKVKSDLEHSLDETEENFERERKFKIDLEKCKRKMEMEIKTMQQQIEECTNLKRGLEELVKLKASENSSLSHKLEDEHVHLMGLQKKNKEIQLRLSEVEEEVETERQGRVKAEKSRADLTRELDELTEKLEEAGGATTAQLELNRKRESELAKLRYDLELANMHHEETTIQMRKKHQEAVNEMMIQIDSLTRAKNNLEKEKQAMKTESDEAKVQAETISKAKMSSDKISRALEQQVNDLNSKLDESNRHTADLVSEKSKLQNTINNLLTQVSDFEIQVTSFTKLKSQLLSNVEAAKRNAEDETRSKNSLVQQIRNLSTDFESLKIQLDEETAHKLEIQRTNIRVQGEAQQWRAKYEAENISKENELEETKRKFAMKVQEAEEQVDTALAKCISLEKTKTRLQCDIEELMIDVEKANSAASSMEKKQKLFDRLIGEWKQKCEDITLELEACQKESRNYSTEIFKLKTQYQESEETNESVRRENKNLADEIKDLMDQLGNGGKNVHELEKLVKRIEIEKEELQISLEEAERALEQSEAKFSMSQLECASVRSEIDRRLQEKEEESENTRRNHQRILESIEASLEAEIKSKNECLKSKKKLENDINQLEVNLDQANRNIAELQKSNKKLHATINELHSQIEDEQSQKIEAKELAADTERRAHTCLTELEELRLSMEQAERSRKCIEQELHESADRISTLTATNANLIATKRQMDTYMSQIKAECEETIVELKNSEEKVKRATSDAARVMEELGAEQEHSQNSERSRKALEVQVSDLQTKLDQAEANALKGGKRLIQKLEQRINEVENEIDHEKKCHQESLRDLRKSERRCKEIALQSEEERKNQARYQEQILKLESKLKTYKRQVEETEEIASLNLSKFRKAQSAYEDLFERAEQAENIVKSTKCVMRSTVSMGRIASPNRAHPNLNDFDI